MQSGIQWNVDFMLQPKLRGTRFLSFLQASLRWLYNSQVGHHRQGERMSSCPNRMEFEMMFCSERDYSNLCP